MNHFKNICCKMIALSILLFGLTISALAPAGEVEDTLDLSPDRPLHLKPVKVRERQRLRFMPENVAGEIDIVFFPKRFRRTEFLARLRFRVSDCGALGDVIVGSATSQSGNQGIDVQYYDEAYILAEPLEVIITPLRGRLAVQINDQTIEIPATQKVRYTAVFATTEYRVSLDGTETFVPRWLAEDK